MKSTYILGMLTLQKIDPGSEIYKCRHTVYRRCLLILIRIIIYDIICSVDDVECFSLPCQNGGGCATNDSGFVCTCIGPYHGVLCELGKYMFRTRQRRI